MKYFNFRISIVFFLFQLSASAQVSLPYFNDFETDTTGWVQNYNDTISRWEWGAPNFGVTNSSHSGTKCWDINLSSQYGNYASSKLISPVFTINNAGAYVLSFWRNQKTEQYFDGARLEYSINGMPFNVLGTINDTNGLNWYTNQLLNPSVIAWEGNSNGWIKSEYKLYGISGQTLQFQFVFTSSSSNVSDGISIDDFQLDYMRKDAGINSINSPLSTFNSSVPQIITSSIKNHGSESIFNFQVKYTIDGGAPVAITYTDTIYGQQSGIVSFPSQLIAPGLHELKIYTELLQDENLNNDTAIYNVRSNLHLPSPYFSSFDINSSGWYNMSIGDPLTNWELGSPIYGSTNNSYSAPNCWDINLNQAYGQNANSILYSPVFSTDSSGIYLLSFWHNFKTSERWDGMQLEYSLNGGNFTELGVYNDTNALNWYNDDHLAGTTDPAWTGNSNGWIHSNCKLHNLNGQNIQFRFIFRSDGVGSRDGYSIDDVHFALSGQDARIRNINSPDSSFESTTLQTVSATIINCGNDTLFNFPVSFQIDNGTPVTIMYVDTLLSLQSDSISFPSQLIPSGGHKIKVYTSVPQDENPSNDSHEMVVAVISTVSTPYTESFDVTGGGWMFSSQLSGSMWDLGYPICSTIGSSHSIPNCWNIGLTGLYNNNSNSILTSPIFLIDSGSTYLVDFWQNYDTENEWDGTRLEYRINNNPYLILGTVNDPNATNWYTNPQIFTSLLPAWEGLSNGWLRSSYIMTGINSSTIQFRFVFDSDWSVTGDGYAIDDFSISKVTGLAQLNNEILLNLYPNPVRDELCIKSDLILNYIITDMTGRTLMTGKSKSGRNLIDVSTFQQGAFLFICSDINGRTRTLKFIKG